MTLQLGFLMHRQRVRLLAAASRRVFFAAVLFAAVLGASLTRLALSHPPPAERFFAWTQLQFPPAEYARRRAALGQALTATGGGVFLAPSRAGLSDGTTFRQLDDFLYFTGLELPDSVLAIAAPAGRTTLFVPRRDPRFESATRPNDFPGRPLADDPALARTSGVDAVRPIEELGPWLQTQAQRPGGLALWMNPGRPSEAGRPGGISPSPAGPVLPPDPLRDFAAYLRKTAPTARLVNAFAAVARLRMVKSPAEIAILRRAARLTAQAIRRAASHGLVHAGTTERDLEAEFEAACNECGTQVFVRLIARLDFEHDQRRLVREESRGAGQDSFLFAFGVDLEEIDCSPVSRAILGIERGDSYGFSRACALQ